MENLQITHSFVRKLAKNIRATYGDALPHTKVIDLVANAVGWEGGALMNALKRVPSPMPSTASKEYGVSADTRTLSVNQVPRLTELVSLDPSSSYGLGELGRRGSGLILAVGKTGSGKTVLSNAMVRHWVEETGRAALLVGDVLEYDAVAAKHGNGVAIYARCLYGHDPLEVIAKHMAYDPAFIVVYNHILSYEHLRSLMEVAREKVVVICSHRTFAVAGQSFIDEMARQATLAGGTTVAEASAHITKELSAIVQLERSTTASGHSNFTAKVGFGNRCF
jgi:hypothetical protein